jgi:hypothetical protein
MSKIILRHVCNYQLGKILSTQKAVHKIVAICWKNFAVAQELKLYNPGNRFNNVASEW